MGVSTSSRVLVPRACCQYSAPTGRTASRVSTPRAAPWCVALTEFSARRRAGYPASSVACGARRPRAGAAWRRSAWRRPPGPGHAVARPGRSPPDPYPFLRLGLQTEGWYTEQWEHKHWAFLSRQRQRQACFGKKCCSDSVQESKRVQWFVNFWQ